MKQFCRRGFSFLLALCMMFSLIPAGAYGAGSAGAYTEGESYFDFDASDYSVRENGETLRVKIVRYGEGSTPANVAVKVADFLSTYGEDYEVLLDGKALSLQEGTVISPSDFTFDDGEGAAAPSAAPSQNAAEESEEAVEAVQADEVEEAVEAAAEAFDAEEAEEIAADDSEEAQAAADDEAGEAADAESGEAQAADAESGEAQAADDAAQAADEAGDAADDAAQADEAGDAADDAQDADDAAEAQAADEGIVSMKRSGSGAAAVDLFSYRPAEETEELVEEAVSVESVLEDADEAEEIAAEEAGDAAEAGTVETPVTAVLQAEAPAKRSKSASPLRDAQAAYLNLPQTSAGAELMQANAPHMFENLHEFFQSAQGAAGVVYFGPGVRERVLTVRALDNDKADGSRMFLIGLLGTDTDETTIAPNATTYVTIEDDDDYEPATFSIVESELVLTRDEPSAKVTITRTGGTQYFGTAYVSTVTGTAKAGAYAQISNKSVGFIPGQTEAQVTVSATDFTRDGTFGIRLESDPLDAVDNHYIDVKILADETAELASADEESDPYGLGFAYELASAEEAEAYYETMAENAENAGTPEIVEKGQPQDAELPDGAAQAEAQAAADAAEPEDKPAPEDAELLEDAELQDQNFSLTLPTAVSASTTISVIAGKTTLINYGIAYIQIRPTVSGTYVFESTNTSGDPYGHLYASNRSTQLTYNDDGAGNRNFRMTYDLTAGTTYYVAARWYNNTSNYGVIQVKATLTARAETTLRQPASAGSVTSREQITQGGQIAYLKFTPSTTGKYIFESFNTSGDPYGYLYSANKSTQLAYNDDGAGNRNFRITYNLTAGTTYYFAVKFYSSSATGFIDCRLTLIGPVYLGTRNITYGNSPSFADFPGGWATEKTGSDNDNKAQIGNTLHVEQYDSGKHSLVYSRSPWTFNGIYNIHFSMEVYGDGSGHFTVFETDSDQTWAGSTASYRQNGKSGWAERDLNVTGISNNHYLKFGSEATKAGSHNPKANLDWFRFDYTQYTFQLMNSCENFNRQLYDFVEGTPQVMEIYYDGVSTRTYTPGALQALSGDYPVLGFFSNANQSMTLTDPNASLNNSRGITLKGVYFAKGDKGYSDMYDTYSKSYRTANSYYVAASNGTVSVTLNPAFVKTLMDKGVVNKNESANETIRIFPVYERKTVEVHFENTDRPNGSKRYDAQNLASYIMNIVEASGQSGSGVTKAVYNGMDYYKMNVPAGSVIRVKTVPSGNRSAAGVYWWTSSNNGTSYYQAGQTIVNPLNTSGTRLTETDFTKADIVVPQQQICMRPATGTQSFYVGYSPLSLNDAKRNRAITSTGSLANAVMDISQGVPSRAELVAGTNTTNDNGNMTLNDARIGKQYSLMVNPPANYYTEWANMTGDTNNDGNITAAERTSQSERSSTPRYVYGNQLFITQDQDNTRYYYLFQPMTNNASRTVRGTITREYNTLLRLATGESTLDYTPIAGAYVNVAGFTGMTNANGEFAIPLKGAIKDWGNISMNIQPQTGDSYSAVTAIERMSSITFPALEVFTAVPNNSSTKGVTASYSDSANAGNISTAGIMVKDDTLSISVSVRHGAALIASKAHFAFYDADGNKRFDCDNREGYRTTTTNGNYLTATLTFNPKRDVQAGDRLWVSFEDQTGKVYAPIDVGYQFAAELTLDQFIFPMLGSSSLEGAYRTLESIDIIGNPLGNIELGSIPGFQVQSESYKPVSNYDISWMQTDYSFGWKKTFTAEKNFGGAKSDGQASNGNSSGSGSGSSSNSAGDKALKDTMKDVKEKNNIGENAQSGSFKASSTFNCSVTPEIGFRLRVSQRYTSQNRGNYFEDLVFYLKVTWGVSASISIATPVGINILIDIGTDGDVAAVYHMFVDYPERFHEEGAQPFTSEDFSVFTNKESTSRYLRREAYIFLNPNITVGLGVGVWVFSVKCSANFAFDMDFRFRSGGTDAYGDMTFTLDWIFELAGFTVYKYRTPLNIQPLRLFNTQGTNEHIELDYQVQAQAALSAALQEVMDGAHTVSLKDARPSSRAYMEYRGDWQQPGDQVSLMSAEGSEESELREGAADNMSVNLLPIGSEGDLLMVYVDDGGDTRANPNKRAVYYSIYTASNDEWSEPAIIEDDGTPDEYPTAQDLGNGQILVAWSSAEMPMPENITLEDMLTSMDLQVAFFDKESRTFGETATLTHMNDEDYAADLMPHAAYDPETGRVILYYTKTEFVDLDELTDVSTAFSAVAYLFYQYDQAEDGTWAATGTWLNTGDEYTEEELAEYAAYWTEENPREEGETDEEYQQALNAYLDGYKANWYGQRFLDTRLDASSSVTPRVVDSSAIGYNGLALYAYTVDWDGSLDTSDDRDVFLQIYNFSENSFSHIIRVTQESGTYTLPQFARSNNSTYLFYGEKLEENERGAIRYLNVSYLIKNEFYEKITNGSSEYYVLRTTTPETTLESQDGTTTVIPAETTDVTGDIAVECSNLTEFDVFVAEDGRMYLLWSASDNEDGCEIYAAVFDAVDEPDDEPDEEEADDGEEAVEAEWSGAVVLTDGGEDVFYTGLGAIGYEGRILAVAGKQQIVERAADSEGDNTVHNSMIQVLHTPFSRAELGATLDVDNYYATTGELVNVTAEVKNVGLDTIPASEEGITVAFQINGEDAGETVYRGSIPGGTSVEVTASLEVPEAESVTITASYDGNTASANLLKEAILSVEDGAFGYATEAIETAEGIIEEGTQIYSANVSNIGNIPSEDAVFTVTVGENTLGSATLSALEARDEAQIVIALEISDDVWQIDALEAETQAASTLDVSDGADGMGTATAVVSAVAGEREIFQDEQTLSKQFDAEAISLLTAYQSSGSIGDTDFTLPVGELEQVQPVIQGVDGLTVEWLSSDDGSIASIDYSNGIYGESAGTTTIHGILVPNREVLAFDDNGQGSRTDWATLIPESLQIPVEAEVTVQEAEETPTTTPTVAPTGTQPTITPTARPTGTTQPTPAPTPGNNSGSSSKQGCYVATSVYGSYDCPEVWTLRRFRDEVLAETWYGRLFIRAYYAVSPTAVKLFGDCDWFQNFFRGRLDQMVSDLQAQGFESTPYNDLQW